MSALVTKALQTGRVAVECDSLKQANRIKYRFYRYCHENPEAEKIMVCIDPETSLLEFIPIAFDNDTILRGLESTDAPSADPEAALARALAKAKKGATE